MKYGNNKIAFSVIVPTYNRPEVLANTLNLLESQNTNIEFEVIVVDDCSTIPLQDLGFGKGNRANWKLLRNEKNLGRAATRNRGIRESRGEYILMIDDDIWASPGLLQAHYEAQQRIGGGVVVGSMLISEEVKKDIWNNYYRRWVGELHDRMEKGKNKLYWWYFFTGNISLPRWLIEEAGFFDECFQHYGSEDSELGYRLWKSGVKIVHEAKARADHFNEETLESILSKRKNWGVSHLLMAKKHPELAEEISVAGILAPGRQYYQLLLNRRFLFFGEIVCMIMASLGLSRMCLFLLEKLSVACYASGMMEALKISGKRC